MALQDWREKATGRLKTLEKRAAWAFLGVAGEGVASQARFRDVERSLQSFRLHLTPDFKRQKICCTISDHITIFPSFDKETCALVILLIPKIFLVGMFQSTSDFQFQAEIKKAFKRRALELHPDKGGDADRFRLLQDGHFFVLQKIAVFQAVQGND